MRGVVLVADDCAELGALAVSILVKADHVLTFACRCQRASTPPEKCWFFRQLIQGSRLTGVQSAGFVRSFPSPHDRPISVRRRRLRRAPGANAQGDWQIVTTDRSRRGLAPCAPVVHGGRPRGHAVPYQRNHGAHLREKTEEPLGRIASHVKTRGEVMGWLPMSATGVTRSPKKSSTAARQWHIATGGNRLEAASSWFEGCDQGAGWLRPI